VGAVQRVVQFDGINGFFNLFPRQPLFEINHGVLPFGSELGNVDATNGVIPNYTFSEK
jgi:hypothetical protein